MELFISSLLLCMPSSAGQLSSNNQQKEPTGGQRARALYNFNSDCDEELSLQVVIFSCSVSSHNFTNLQSICITKAPFFIKQPFIASSVTGWGYYNQFGVR